MYNLEEHNTTVCNKLSGKTWAECLEICKDLLGIKHEISEDVYFKKLGSSVPYGWTKEGFLFGIFSFGPYTGHYYKADEKFWYELVNFTTIEILGD